ncbi:MAG: murein biosynthesis integral membrane protein MurJ [Planctomycetaceae bacterium]|nr:murein biosynthesis integral membrane protein MurJ [Planctomycetaceae bacterium]
MIRGFRQIAVLTFISRIFGMFRDMAFAFFLGADNLMDAWVIAFKIPNLARGIFGEGAASSSLIPVYSEEYKKDPKQANVLARTVSTLIFVILTGIVLAGEVGLFIYILTAKPTGNTRLMLILAGVMLPYMTLVCTVAILGGVLNAHRHFSAPANAPTILNIIMISALAVSGWLLKLEPRYQVFFMAISVLMAGLVQILTQLLPLWKMGLSMRPAWQLRMPALKKIMLLMGPMILGLTATQINTLAGDIIARVLSGSEEKGHFFMFFGHQVAYPVWAGAVSSLFYGQRLYQFPLGVLGISLATAIFPVLSAAAAEKDHALISRTIGRGIQATFFVALPATVGLILIARPLVTVLFERGRFTANDSRITQGVLICYSIGLCGYFLQQVVTRAFYAIQDSKWPARTAALSVAVSIALNLVLIWPLGAAGLALSTACCSYLQALILLLVLGRQFKGWFEPGDTLCFIKTVTATAIMLLAGLAVLRFTSGWPVNHRFDLLRIIVSVAVCGGVFIIASWLLKNRMLSLLTGSHKS